MYEGDWGSSASGLEMAWVLTDGGLRMRWIRRVETEPAAFEIDAVTQAEPQLAA